MLVTGSGRVSHGVIEVLNLMGLHDVEPEDFLSRTYTYPVYTQLKGGIYMNIKQRENIQEMIFIKTHRIIPANFFLIAMLLIF